MSKVYFLTKEFSQEHFKYFCSPYLKESQQRRQQLCADIDKMLADFQVQNKFTVPMNPRLRVTIYVDTQERAGAQPVYYMCTCEMFGNFAIGDYTETSFVEVSSDLNPYADQAMLQAMTNLYVELYNRINRGEDISFLGVLEKNEREATRGQGSDMMPSTTTVLLQNPGGYG